jgi:hypothetical protein
MLKRMLISTGGAVALALFVVAGTSPAQDRGAAGKGAGGAATTERGLVFSGKVLRIDVAHREVVLRDVMGPTTGTGGGVGPRDRATADRGGRNSRDLDKGDTATGGRAGDTAGPVDRTDTGRLGTGPNTMEYTLHFITNAQIMVDGRKADLRDVKPGMFARAHVLGPEQTPTTGTRAAPRETARERDIREAIGTPGAPGTGTSGAGAPTTSANARNFRWSADRIEAFSWKPNATGTATNPRAAEKR